MNKIALYKNLGSELISRGQWFLKQAFNVKVERIVNKTHIRNLFTSLGFDYNKVLFADTNHLVVSIATMEDIIKYSWVDRKKYIVEHFDCDDYALAFKAHVSEIYNINSVALAKHIQVIKSNGEKLWHRACVFLAIDNFTLKAYLLETQNDKLIEIKNALPTELGTWKYQLDTFEF